MKPCISVIVPVYNVEKYLRSCLDSIIHQTYQNLEIIVIDDGSTDSSSKICDEYKKKDKRIRVIHKKNSGISDVRNKGVEAVTGEYIGFIDSDDEIEPTMYEVLMKNMLENNADISVCGYVRYPEDSKPVFKKNDQCTVYNTEEALAALLDNKIENYLCNKLFKKEIFDNILFPVGKKYEDLGVTYLLIDKANKIAKSDNKFYGYRIRKGSITGYFDEQSYIDKLELRNKRETFLMQNYPSLQEHIDKNTAGHIYEDFLAIYKFKEEHDINKPLYQDQYKKYQKIVKKYGIKKITKHHALKHKVFMTLLYKNPKLFQKILISKNQ